MNNIGRQIYEELKLTPQAVAHVLLVFLSLIVAFGVLSSNHPSMWQTFLPTLLMGLSYGVISLSLDQLFREDWEDGTLEWRMSQNTYLEGYVFVKILAHWIRLGLPLTMIVGLITSFGSLPLVLGVGMTTLSLTFLGAIASALCLNCKSSCSILLPLLTLPLGIPMMIVSMAAVADPTAGMTSYFAIQCGLSFMSVALSLIACPFALRLTLR
ncbi:MAG: heme exporter protein CcmB [Alphaproteobacteria bacterium]|jgi:heme exporter protein B|nr:heme exporter protein CcmB [Alphaproteobacteria bacterium]